MREELRSCDTCSSVTMHERSLLSRWRGRGVDGWECSRCVWKRKVDQLGLDDGSVTMVHVFEIIWIHRPRGVNRRFRKPRQITRLIDF